MKIAIGKCKYCYSFKRAMIKGYIKKLQAIYVAPEELYFTWEEECDREMFVTIRWEREGLAAPLSQLKPIDQTATEIKEAVETWHYWIQMGYQFG